MVLIIYVKKDGDKIMLSNDGYILNDLSSDGVSLKGKAKQRILNEFLNFYGVANNNGELTFSIVSFTPRVLEHNINCFVCPFIDVKRIITTFGIGKIFFYTLGSPFCTVTYYDFDTVAELRDALKETTKRFAAVFAEKNTLAPVAPFTGAWIETR